MFLQTFKPDQSGPAAIGSSHLGPAANEAEMVALSTAVAGSTCTRTDTGTVWILKAAPYSTASNWQDTGNGGDGSTTWEDVSTTTYTATAADFASDGTAKTKRFTNAAGCLVTPPAALGLAKGKVMKWLQASGAGQVTFQGDGTSTVTSASGDLVSAGELSSGYLECQGSDDFLLVGQIGDGTAPSAFTSRTLARTDDGNVLVCATAQTATVNTGLPAGFGCSFKGAVSFAGTATVTDLRKSGETVIWCALVNTGTNTYDVVGGKA